MVVLYISILRFYGAEIIVGLQFLHSKGIIYRLKNILNQCLESVIYIKLQQISLELNLFLDFRL